MLTKKIDNKVIIKQKSANVFRDCYAVEILWNVRFN